MSTHRWMGASTRPRHVAGIPVHRRIRDRLCFAALNAGMAIFLIFLTGIPRANSEPAPPYAMLFQESAARAPRLLEAQANARAAEGRSDQAGLLPNPTVSFYSENLGSRAATGFSALQNTLSVSEPIELFGKRTARIAVGFADIKSAQAAERLTRVVFGYDLALAYLAAEAAQARIGLYQAALDAAQEDLRASQALVSAGREAELRAVQAGSALATAQSDLQTGRSEFQTALGTLTALVASPTPYTDVSPSLLPMIGSLRVAATPPAEFPAVAAAEAERQAAAERVSVERTRPAPTITATLGARRIEGFNSTLFVAGLAVPLPLFDDNRGNITAALAELDAADIRVRATRAQAEAGWATALREVETAESRLGAARQAETAADSAYRLSRIGYESGRTPLSEVLIARRNLTDSQLREIDAQVGRIRAEANLNRLSGRIPFGPLP